MSKIFVTIYYMYKIFCARQISCETAQKHCLCSPRYRDQFIREHIGYAQGELFHWQLSDLNLHFEFIIVLDLNCIKMQLF